MGSKPILAWAVAVLEEDWSRMMLFSSARLAAKDWVDAMSRVDPDHGWDAEEAEGMVSRPDVCGSVTQALADGDVRFILRGPLAIQDETPEATYEVEVRSAADPSDVDVRRGLSLDAAVGLAMREAGPSYPVAQHVADALREGEVVSMGDGGGYVVTARPSQAAPQAAEPKVATWGGGLALPPSWALVTVDSDDISEPIVRLLRSPEAAAAGWLDQLDYADIDSDLDEATLIELLRNGTSDGGPFNATAVTADGTTSISVRGPMRQE